MIVKNVWTDDLEIFINELLYRLCKENISYVYIPESKELHYGGYIYRFHQRRSHQMTLRGIINKREYFNNILSDPKWFPKFKEVELIDSNDLGIDLYEDFSRPTNNRYDIKNNNHQTNMVLKRSQKHICNVHRKLQ